ncbi:MAG: hypothetical protein VKO00_03710 [Cyanobacteriota bacterium]|nr:hypothetical protein [Cyanobacteriota bacterium]
MAVPLILHAGMHKTGTSSIQQTLYRYLRDPRFRYIGCGLVNGSRAIHALVSQRPGDHHTHRDQGLNERSVLRLQRQFRHCWQQQLSQARSSGAIPIVSAEECWILSRAELQNLRAMIEAEGFRAQVVVYLRSPLSWLSSMVQELLKNSLFPVVDELFTPRLHAWGSMPYLQPMYVERLAMLEDVFGVESLRVRHFRGAALRSSCVVEDFCHLIGLKMDPALVCRSNDAMSVDASRLLYAYNQWTRQQTHCSFWAHTELLKALQTLSGFPLKLHPHILRPLASILDQQKTVIQDRYGIDLTDSGPIDETGSIQARRDLYQFSPESLRWLGSATGCAPVDAGQDGASRLVAEQMRIFSYSCGGIVDRLYARISRLSWHYRWLRMAA